MYPYVAPDMVTEDTTTSVPFLLKYTPSTSSFINIRQIEGHFTNYNDQYSSKASGA